MSVTFFCGFQEHRGLAARGVVGLHRSPSPQARSAGTRRPRPLRAAARGSGKGSPSWAGGGRSTLCGVCTVFPGARCFFLYLRAGRHCLPCPGDNSPAVLSLCTMFALPREARAGSTTQRTGSGHPHRGACQYDNQAHWLRHPRGAEYKRPNPEVRCDPRPPLVTAFLSSEFNIGGSIAATAVARPESGVKTVGMGRVGNRKYALVAGALNSVLQGP